MSALQVLESPRGSDMQWWTMAKDQAAMLVKTGFLPESIKTPEQAVAIMMKGRELGIPAMYALSNIVIIKGKPTCNSELMLALIYRDHGNAAIRIVNSTNDACQIAYRRKSWPKEQTYAFTVQDATRAGLMSSPTWKQYTAAMLRARCISAVARMAFPDSIAGMYTAEELGGRPEIEDDGEGTFTVVDVTTGEIGAGPVAEGAGEDEEPAPQSWFRRLFAVANEHGLDDTALHTLAGVASLKGFTKTQINDLVEKIKAPPDDEGDEPISDDDEHFDAGDR